MKRIIVQNDKELEYLNNLKIEGIRIKDDFYFYPHNFLLMVHIAVVMIVWLQINVKISKPILLKIFKENTNSIEY